MPLCTIHLLSLHTTTPAPLPTFLSTLRSTPLTPLITARVIRWIILPTHLSTTTLLSQNIHWDLLLILPSTDPLPAELVKLVQHHWSITAGIPSSLVSDFHAKNEKLLHPDRHGISIPALLREPREAEDKVERALSSHSLELSSELQTWIQRYTHSGPAENEDRSGAVSMLNLLAFKPGMKESYLKYGSAFKDRVGSRFGGNAKLVGSVVSQSSSLSQPRHLDDSSGWDEIALAHYPSLHHFAAMLGSADYQAANKTFRLPSLRDTCILFTEEIGVEKIMGMDKGNGAKL
ncbi:hypothetical protein P154DRAFT_500793 [Amniculicola lignicola CBS 123094]|uniref:Uncharacterized protein n=1 Tax=Amniculicola lignicola CBS 123094 TaxID=1392246 RepID=A0A6A5VZJ8_9PLEO|nr:hypothetical protein P154DRAFT_500793 [Amniculicola lignicola CBS 123094]